MEEIKHKLELAPNLKRGLQRQSKNRKTTNQKVILVRRSKCAETDADHVVHVTCLLTGV